MLLALLFFLVAAHAVADFALQTEAIATCKCRRSDNPVAKAVPWYYWLSAHALIHGGTVGAVVRWFGVGWDEVVAVAAAETVVHWLIDFGKCERWYGIHADQGLHVGCKFVWVAVLFGAGVLPTPRG